MAIKIIPRSNHTMLIVFTLITQEISFALARTAEFNLYGYIMTKTNIPNSSYWKQRGRTFQARSKISVNNFDIFTYINSKFVYVEKHIRFNLSSSIYQYNGAKVCVEEAKDRSNFRMLYLSLASHRERNGFLNNENFRLHNCHGRRDNPLD